MSKSTVKRILPEASTRHPIRDRMKLIPGSTRDSKTPRTTFQIKEAN